MPNFRHYPDEGIIEFRDEDDIEYIVVSEEDWDQNIISGFSTHYYSIACQYAREHANDNWVITCI